MERRKIIIEEGKRRCLPITYVNAINKIINKEIKNINVTKQTKLYIPKGLLSLNDNNINATFCSDPNEADYILLNAIEKETMCYMYQTKEAYLNCSYSYLERLRKNNIVTETQNFSISSCIVSKKNYSWLEDFEKFNKKKIYNINSFVYLFKEKFNKQELKDILEYIQSDDDNTKILGLTLLSEKNLYDHFYDITMFFHNKVKYLLFKDSRINKNIKKMYNFYHIDEWLNKRISSGYFEHCFYNNLQKHKNFINEENKKRFAKYFSQQIYYAIYHDLGSSFNTNNLNYSIKITMFDFPITYSKDTSNMNFKQLQKEKKYNYINKLQYLTSLYEYLNSEGKDLILNEYKKELASVIKNFSYDDVKIEIIWEK